MIKIIRAIIKFFTYSPSRDFNYSCKRILKDLQEQMLKDIEKNIIVKKQNDKQ